MRYGSARGTREDAKLRRTAYSGDYFHNRRPDMCGVFLAAPSSRPIQGELETSHTLPQSTCVQQSKPAERHLALIIPAPVRSLGSAPLFMSFRRTGTLKQLAQ